MSITRSGRTLTNDERIELWRFARDVQTLRRQETGTYRPATAGRVFLDLLGLVSLFAFLAALFIGAAWLAGQIKAAPEPETRCFKTAVAETDYCREQWVWGN